MKKRKSVKAKSAGIPSFLIAVLINAAVYTAVSFLFTIVAYFSSDPTGRVKLFSLFALLITGAICGMAVEKRSEGKYTALLSALAFSIIMLLLGVIVSKTAPGIGNIVNYAIYIGVCAAFSWLSCKHTGKSRFRRH